MIQPLFLLCRNGLQILSCFQICLKLHFARHNALLWVLQGSTILLYVLCLSCNLQRLCVESSHLHDEDLIPCLEHLAVSKSAWPGYRKMSSWWCILHWTPLYFPVPLWRPRRIQPLACGHAVREMFYNQPKNATLLKLPPQRNGSCFSCTIWTHWQCWLGGLWRVAHEGWDLSALRIQSLPWWTCQWRVYKRTQKCHFPVGSEDVLNFWSTWIQKAKKLASLLCILLYVGSAFLPRHLIDISHHSHSPHVPYVNASKQHKQDEHIHLKILQLTWPFFECNDVPIRS